MLHLLCDIWLLTLWWLTALPTLVMAWPCFIRSILLGGESTPGGASPGPITIFSSVNGGVSTPGGPSIAGETTGCTCTHETIIVI